MVRYKNVPFPKKNLKRIKLLVIQTNKHKSQMGFLS